MERMREKVKEREEMRTREKMAFVALDPLHLTIFCLVDSNRVSMDPRSLEILIFAAQGVDRAVEVVKFLEKFRGRIQSTMIEALEAEICEAALDLENVLDSLVSYQFLSQSRRPSLFSLNLEGIEQDIKAFVEKAITVKNLVNPGLGDEEEEEGGDGSEEEEEEEEKEEKEEEDNDDDDDEEEEEEEEDNDDDEEEEGGRSWFISWFATEAASIFFGTKEDYILELENLLPHEQEFDEEDDYAVLFITDSSKMVSEDSVSKVRDDLTIWWINKAAASIFVKERDSTQRLVNPLPQFESESESESGVNMVGSTDLFCKIRDDLLEDFEDLIIGIIVGMTGIGKTALTKKIIQDPLILTKFEYCIFVRLGPEYEWEQVLAAIVAQMPNGDKLLIGEDVDLEKSVQKTLTDRRCLVVLDDYWNGGLGDIFQIIPRGSSQSAILFTSRLSEDALDFQLAYMGPFYQVSFLNSEESWDLLRGKIFGENRCPSELEKPGRKIAENCEGLPLLILAVGGLLSQAEKTPEYWSKIAANKTNSIFVGAYEQVSEVVYPSYHYLPQHLKPCFLYLSAFPQNDEIRISRLISLWSADGFLGVRYTLLQEHTYDLSREMVSHNVALGTQWNTCDLSRLKALSLHSVFWYLCKREARNEKFLHVLNSYTDASVQGIKSQRRLSIYNNTILSIKDVRDSIASISALHSLLCTGPYHQYEVSVCFGLRLLKVLDVLTIRFYDFPIEVLKLVQLRYLGLTCNGNLPPSISNLWGLQCLILHQHQSIKSTSVSHSYLPVEIWELQELEHLQIIGRNLPDPPPGAVLRKLMILLDVSAQTCTESVLASIPNLVKLRVHIELMPVAAEPLRFCDDISHLRKLESLQFIVVNPEVKFEIVGPAAFVSFSYLTKLTLSGFGYPWKDIHKIAELSHLNELKLKCYAFRGEKWLAKEGEFERLRYLLIEDTDLVWWTGNFRGLRILTIKNCYRLLELPELPSVIEILVVDCNPSAVSYAKELETDRCSVYVDCSWLVDKKHS